MFICKWWLFKILVHSIEISLAISYASPAKIEKPHKRSIHSSIRELQFKGADTNLKCSGHF